MDKIINEECIINDYCPIGIVTFTDENGNIIFKKHNMVVNGGRQIILRELSKYLNLLDTSALPTFSNIFIRFGTSENITKRSTTAISNSGIKDIILANSANSDNKIGLDTEGTEGIIEISTKITSANLNNISAITISEMGLFINETTTEGEKSTLFSRVVFDPVVISSSSTYTLTYKIYF